MSFMNFNQIQFEHDFESLEIQLNAACDWLDYWEETTPVYRLVVAC